ncbi:MAG: ABC transporter permease [bacterium]
MMVEAGNFVATLLAGALRAGTPLVFATIGEIFTERAGVLNLGIEGILLSGALSAFAVAQMTGSLWAGVGAGILMGLLLGAIHAFLSVSLRANQVVSGLSLTIFGTGLSGVLGKNMVGIPGRLFQEIPIPILEKIPFLGGIFFRQNAMVYLSYLLIFLSFIYLFRTRGGLMLRSCGENPQAAESSGVNAGRVRWMSVLFGGAMAGLGGAYLSLAYNNQWIEGMSAGRGWIALALVIFGGWNPLRAALGAYLFGGLDSLQFKIQAAGAHIPAPLLLMTPYLFTLLVLLFSSGEKARRKMSAPAALGLPYTPGERE